MPNIDDIAKAAGEATKIVPELYKDGLQGAVQETGVIIRRFPRFVNALLAPLDIWIQNREYKVAQTERLLEEKLKHIPDEELVTPEPHIAVPALQAISYCMDNDTLRDMFANLLANAMQKNTKDQVHPSFVEVIKQMSPRDASNISLFYNNPVLPIANYDLVLSENSIHQLLRNAFISNPLYTDIEEQAVSITALARLGLVDISFDSSIKDKSVYAGFKQTDFYLNYVLHHIRRSDGSVYLTTRVAPTDERIRDRILYGSVSVNPYGNLFVETCVIYITRTKTIPYGSIQL